MKKLLLTLVAVLTCFGFVKATDVTFDFVSSNLASYGYSSGGNLKEDTPITNGIVQIAWSKATSTATASTQLLNFNDDGNLYCSTNSKTANQTLTFTANDNIITKVVFTYSKLNLSVSEGNLTTGTWEGASTSLIFTTKGGGNTISKIVVTYEDGGSLDPGTKAIAWPKSSYTATYGQAFESPVLNYSSDEFAAEIAEIEYSSSNPDVASIDKATGEVTIHHASAEPVTITATAIDNNAEIYEASYTLTIAKAKASVKWAPESASVISGKESEFTQPTLTFDPEGIEAAASYTSDNEEVAMFDDTTKEIVFMGATGTANITVTVNDADYETATATYTLTVNEEGYVEPTTKTIELSAYLFGLETSYAYKTYKDPVTNITFATRSQKSNGIALQADGGFLGITANPENYTIKTVSVKAKTTSSKNPQLTVTKQSSAYSFGTGSSNINPIAGTQVLTQTYAANKETSFEATVNDYFFAFNNSTTSGQIIISSLVVTVEKSNKQPAGLSFGETTDFVVAEGEAFTAPELQNPNELAVEYASDNEAVATVDATTGAVTIVGTGTATITATSEENETYNAGSASYAITVKTAANTLAEYLEKAAANGATAIINCDLIVTYANGANVYVTDEQRTAYSLIYKYNLGYNKGDVIPAGWNAKTTIYNGLFEIIPDGDMPAATETVDVEYETVTEFGVADINKLVILNDVTLTSATAGTAPAGQEFTLYNNFKLSGVPTSGKFNIIGVIGYYEKGVTSTENLKVEKLQLQPVEYQIHQDNVGKVFFSQNIAAESDQRWELFEEDSYTSSDNAIYVKFEAGEGHKVYFRYKDINGNVVAPILVDEPAETTEPAEQTAALANETATADEEGFTEYTKPARFEVAGSLEHYTVHTESGVKTAVKTITASGVTGIEDIVADGDEADAVYYNLQGVRVDNPENGLYIRVRGNKVEKVVK